MNTDTPRTDARQKLLQQHPDYIDADFARQLERELNQEKATIAAMREALTETISRLGNYDWNADKDNITLLQGKALSTDAGKELLERLNNAEEKSRNANALLYGCDKHRMWSGMACIGCMEEELSTLKSAAKETVESNEKMLDAIVARANGERGINWMNLMQQAQAAITKLKGLIHD